jgi:hypothetical protein
VGRRPSFSLGRYATFFQAEIYASLARVHEILIGYNTLRRHLHLIGLSDSPLCMGCGAEDETSDQILCECEALASHRYVYLGSSSLEPEDIKSISLEATWNFSKVAGLP